jgi:hypothetical protein
VILAYLSHDEVNLALALRLAEGAGALLRPLFIRDRPSDVSFDAILWDLDCLPVAERAATLKALLAGPLTCPVGCIATAWGGSRPGPCGQGGSPSPAGCTRG